MSVAAVSHLLADAMGITVCADIRPTASRWTTVSPSYGEEHAAGELVVAHPGPHGGVGRVERAGRARRARQDEYHQREQRRQDQAPHLVRSR